MQQSLCNSCNYSSAFEEPHLFENSKENEVLSPIATEDLQFIENQTVDSSLNDGENVETPTESEESISIEYEGVFTDTPIEYNGGTPEGIANDNVVHNDSRSSTMGLGAKFKQPLQILGKVTAVQGLSTLIVRFDGGTETHYHIDHVKAQIQEGEKEFENFQQPGLLPAIATTSDRQPDLPLAPTAPIADVEPGPEPLVGAAPPVLGLEAVPLHPTLTLYPSSPIP
eukprot:Em0003g1600a